MTTNFVRDFSGTAGLKGPVADLFAAPVGDELHYADADKWNEIRQAMFDVRGWIKTGLTNGTFSNATLIVDADGRITGVASGSGGGVPTTRLVSAGTGLSGGGDLSADRTLALANTAVTPGSYTHSSLTVDAQGRLTAASSGTAPAPATRLISTTAPLAGGGDLSADRTLTVATFGTGAAGVVPASGVGTSMLRGDATWRTPTQVKADLAIAAGDVSGLAATATSTNAANLTGTLAAAQMPALTGDVMTSAGGVATTIAALAVSTGKIAANAVTLAKVATQADQTILGNNTGGSAAPLAMTAAQTRTVLGLATVATSGLASDLTGTLAAAQLPALTGDVTTSAGSAATTIAAHVVTYAKQSQAAANTMAGNNTGSTADKIDLTVAQVLAMLTGTTGLHLHDIGDGHDGTPVFDGVNTFTWATLVGSTYTLTSPVFWNGATINAGITIKPDGWSIRSNADIVNNGDVNVNGNAAITTTGGLTTWTTASRDLPGGSTGGSASSSAASISGAPQVFSATAAGGGSVGSNPAGTGGTGTAGGLGHGSGGGGGGGGAANTGNAGGNGGGLTVSSLTTSGGGHVLEYQIAITGRTRTAVQFTCATGGGGGGAGGGAGAGSGGAGGGAAGWMVVLALSISGSGTWRAVGGAATNGAVGGAGAGGGGGGAGGGGGLIAMRVCLGAYPTVDVSGGASGSGGAGGAGGGAGGPGPVGGAGYRIKL